MQVLHLLVVSLAAQATLSLEPEKVKLKKRVLSGSGLNDGFADGGFPVDSVDPRIVGGTDAAEGEFPFFVQGQGCGASLIAEDVVLTAAHCEAAFVYLDYVIVGNYLLNQVTEGAEQRAIVSSMYIHPEFSTWDISHDFMLFKIEPAQTVKPIPFNTNSAFPTNDQPLTVIGFGSTSTGGSASSRLQKVTVKAMPHDECNSETYLAGSIDEQSMFCAGEDGGGKDSCQGDSGGPIFDENMVLMGVVSWGAGCGLPNSPGVYARISGDLDFIQRTVCELTDTNPSYCEGLPPVSPPTYDPPVSTPGFDDTQVFDDTASWDDIFSGGDVGGGDDVVAIDDQVVGDDTNTDDQTPTDDTVLPPMDDATGDDLGDDTNTDDQTPTDDTVPLPTDDATGDDLVVDDINADDPEPSDDAVVPPVDDATVGDGEPVPGGDGDGGAEVDDYWDDRWWDDAFWEDTVWDDLIEPPGISDDRFVDGNGDGNGGGGGGGSDQGTVEDIGYVDDQSSGGGDDTVSVDDASGGGVVGDDFWSFVGTG